MSISISGRSKIIGLGVIAGILSITAFAEPAVQPGETLESLSKVKVTTTVNGQPGSLKELAESGKIKIISDTAEQPTSEATADEASASEVAAPADAASEVPASEMPASEAAN
jgi:hypothetical protein